MAKIYQVTSAVVKVSIGPSNGSRVARILKRGGIVPEGVEQAKLEALEKLGMIELVADPEADAAKEAADADEAAAATAAAEEKAKADADAAAAKAAADAEAAKVAAAGKTTAAKAAPAGK